MYFDVLCACGSSMVKPYDAIFVYICKDEHPFTSSFDVHKGNEMIR